MLRLRLTVCARVYDNHPSSSIPIVWTLPFLYATATTHTYPFAAFPSRAHRPIIHFPYNYGAHSRRTCGAVVRFSTYTQRIPTGRRKMRNFKPEETIFVNSTSMSVPIDSTLGRPYICLSDRLARFFAAPLLLLLKPLMLGWMLKWLNYSSSSRATQDGLEGVSNAGNTP